MRKELQIKLSLISQQWQNTHAEARPGGGRVVEPFSSRRNSSAAASGRGFLAVCHPEKIGTIWQRRVHRRCAAIDGALWWIYNDKRCNLLNKGQVEKRIVEWWLLWRWWQWGWCRWWLSKNNQISKAKCKFVILRQFCTVSESREIKYFVQNRKADNYVIKL